MQQTGHKQPERVARQGNQLKKTMPNRVIDIGSLGEDELLCMVRGYIKSMFTFSQNTRNVHKDLKETLSNTNIVMVQSLK